METYPLNQPHQKGQRHDQQHGNGRQHDGRQTAFSEHRVPRGQGSIYARDYKGAGSTFVLMHGFPDNLYIYDDLVPYLWTTIPKTQRETMVNMCRILSLSG